MRRDDSTVLVLGGGVIGVTSAYFLAKAGFRVTLVERRKSVGLEASYANGALVTSAMADTWAAPGMPLNLLRWIGRPGSPFLVHLSALPGLAFWGLEFIRNCSLDAWQRNSRTNLRIAQYSQRILQQLIKDITIPFDRSTLGTLKLFRDGLSIENAQRSVALFEQLGVRNHLLEPDQCVNLEPALAPNKHLISGGLHFPDDESGDAFKFTASVADAARLQGVEFLCSTNILSVKREGDRIASVRTDAGELKAGRYLLAAGWAAPRIVVGTGLRMPIYPVKGYSVTFSTDGWEALPPKVPILDDGRKLGIVRLGNRLRVVGTAEFAGADTSLNRERLQSIVSRATDLFPDLARKGTGKEWVGMRPMTPDGVPIIGHTPLTNLFVNVGHGHLGWTMACGTAKAIADLIGGVRLEVDLTGTAYGRSVNGPASMERAYQETPRLSRSRLH